VMMERWRDLLPVDPFYNRHFARDGGIYRDLRVLEPAHEIPLEQGKSASFSEEKEAIPRLREFPAFFSCPTRV
jgi:hypothetical protein